MTSEAPFLHCRLCGIRFRSDKVTEHEIRCSQPQSPDAAGNEATNRNSRATLPKGVNEIRDKAGSYAAPGGSNATLETRTTSPSDSYNQVLQNSKAFPAPKGQNYTGEVSVQATKNDQQANSDSRHVDPNEVRGNKYNPESNDQISPNDVNAFRRSREGIEFQSDNGTSERDLVKGSNSKDTNREDDHKKMMERNPYPSSNIKQNEGLATVQKNQQESLDTKSEDAANGKDDYGLAELLKDQRKLSDQQIAFKERRESMVKTPSPTQNPKQNYPVPQQSSSESAHEEFLENLPEPSPEAETAYRQHRKSLVPCTHCDRKFVPGRLSVHERSCIQRPKTREYMTPDKKSPK